jgi:hypothetical protein
MTKPLGGIHPIIVGEALYRLTSPILCIQFHKKIATHFFSHQFGITRKGGCEIVIHDIRCTLDLQPILTHFRVLRSITSHFPSCLFPSIANDTHIIGPPLIVSFAYEHF